MSATYELLEWKKEDLVFGNYINSWINDGEAIAAPHWHREIEIILIIEGTVKLGVNKKEIELPKGEFYIINTGDVHYFLPSPNSERIIIQLDLAIFDDLQCVKENQIDLIRLFNNAQKSSHEWNQKLKQKKIKKLQDIHQEFTEKDLGFEIAIRAKLYEMVLILYREVPWVEVSDDYSSKGKKNVMYLKEIYNYLEENYQNNISLNDVANYIGFTPSYFSKFFKKHHGITFLKYLTQYRLTKVQWRLLNQDLSITEIAYASGFVNLKTFNRIFKSELGLTPTEFRKRQFLRDLRE